MISLDVYCYALHNCIHRSLSMNLRIISLSFKPLQLRRYLKNVSLCFRRSRVPSTYPVGTTFSSSSLRITSPSNVISLRIMSSNRCLPYIYARLLNFEMSSKMQGCARRVHCSMCAVFSVARPHSHVVSLSKYCHFFRCSLLHV